MSRNADNSRVAHGAEKTVACMPICVEFTGGLELFFSNQRKHLISLPIKDENEQSPTMAFLIRFLCQNHMQRSRSEMFMVDGTIRPGILVLVNDADWELEGSDRYELQAHDNILFVSTLHGG